MNKKIILLGAAVLALQAVPALAQEGGGNGRGGGMFKHHDANGDGVITKDEFLKRAEERFIKMDKNGDGEVTKDEAKGARAHMKDKMKERRKKWKENHQGDGSDE